VSLVGNLADLGLGEILQIVSLSRKSGVLTLQSRGRQGIIVFRFGQVVRATSSSIRYFLGEDLLKRKVVDEECLNKALQVQQGSAYKEKLGPILINRFNIPVEKIEEVVREQIERVVYSFFSWDEGSFEFELQDDIETIDDSRIDPLQFMLQQGINPQFLAMEGSRIIDEKRRLVSSLVTMTTAGSFRVNSTTGPHMTISDLVQKIPICSCTCEMKNCQVLGLNSYSFRSYSPLKSGTLTFFGAPERESRLCSPFILL